MNSSDAQQNTNSMFGMQDVFFKTNEEALEKLKEVGILSKTKEVSDLSEIIYREKDNQNKMKSYKCEILGYSWKETPPECINKIYENLIVKSNNKIFYINIDHLKDMQKNKKEKIQKGHFAHLVTGPRKGVIVKITNMKLNPQEDILLTAIQKGFNEAMKEDYTKQQISKIYTDLYDILEYNDDFTEFKLMKDFSQCSLGHKTKDYKFVESSFSVAEINSKNHQRVVAIDFETANSQRDSVCSIGFVVQDGDEITFEKEILVNPKCEFSKRNIKIHGITPTDVINSPDWSEAWPEVEQYITSNTLVIAHNLRSMELSCIRKECERYNMPVPPFAQLRSKMAYDTLKLSKDLLPNAKDYKLSTLTEMYNIELNHHNALSDAKACLELFNILQKEI